MTVGPMGESVGLVGGRYRLIRDLGQGGFGHTYLAEDSNRFNELCVLKEFVPQVTDPALLQKAKHLFEREAGVLYQINHPQIPRFRELLRGEVGDQGRLFLVQDYVEGPTYQELLETRLRGGQRFSEPEVTQLLAQLLPVLDYLHGIGVIHRDIAPDNLILRNADGLPVLIDFGGVKQLATQLVQQQLGQPENPTRLGKAGYAPAEQLDGGAIGPSADLYALAVTALVMLTGEPPQALYDAYQKTWRWQQHCRLSPRLSAVLTRMLAPIPRDRYPSAAAVLQDLQTPQFYAQGNGTAAYGTANPGAEFRPDPTLVAAPGRGSHPSTLPVPPAGPSPTPRAVPPTPKGGSGCWQALLGLVLLVGAVGLVWWVASRWEPTSGGSTPEAVTSAPENPAFSPEEQARKTALRQRREALGVDERFLVGITDQLFYSRFPEMQGQALSDRPEDADMRAGWDEIALEILEVLDQHLSAEARRQLGNYGPANREGWEKAVNPLFVSTSALFDLADAKFAYLFPDSAQGDFINQPIGQIWYGLADDRVRSLQSGDRLETLQFETGSFGQSIRDRLEPGEGRVYTLNLSEGQLLRLNLQAPNGSTRLSLYVPRPSEDLPYYLADASDTTWSGDLAQSGYYEIVVVSTIGGPLDYALDVSVDNVTAPSTPEPEADTPAAEEEDADSP
jgi:serine/threonine-protein kinase